MGKKRCRTWEKRTFLHSLRTTRHAELARETENCENSRRRSPQNAPNALHSEESDISNQIAAVDQKRELELLRPVIRIRHSQRGNCDEPRNKCTVIRQLRTGRIDGDPGRCGRPDLDVRDARPLRILLGALPKDAWKNNSPRGGRMVLHAGGWRCVKETPKGKPREHSPNQLLNSGRRCASCCCNRATMLECIWLTRDSERPSVVPISFIVSSS